LVEAAFKAFRLGFRVIGHRYILAWGRKPRVGVKQASGRQRRLSGWRVFVRT
jgi:hypothetical protein